jgi:hypothetical protein
MLDQERASGAERPRQNRIEEVVLLEIVKVKGFIIRMKAKLNLTKTKGQGNVKRKGLPIRVIVYIDAGRPQLSRRHATMRHEMGHHVIENSRNASWLDRVVGVLIPATIRKKARSHLAELVPCTLQ